MPECNIENMRTRLLVSFILLGVGMFCQISVFVWYCWIFFIRSESGKSKFTRATLVYAFLIFLFPMERGLRCLHLYYQFFGPALITSVIHQSCNALMALTALLVVLAQLQRLKSCFEDSVYSISDTEYLRLLGFIVTGVLSMMLWSILFELRSVIGLSRMVGNVIVVSLAVISVVCLVISLGRMNYAFGVRLKSIVAKDTVNHIDFDPLPQPLGGSPSNGSPNSEAAGTLGSSGRRECKKSPNSLSTTMITPSPSLAGGARSKKENSTVPGVADEAEVAAGRAQALSLSMTVSRTVTRNSSAKVIQLPQSSLPKLEVLDTVSSGEDLAEPRVLSERKDSLNDRRPCTMGSTGNRSISEVFDQRYRRQTSGNSIMDDAHSSHHRKGSTLEKLRNASILKYSISQARFLETAARATIICIFLTLSGILVFISSVLFMFSDCLHTLVFVAHLFVGFSGCIVSLVILLSFTQTNQEYHYCCDVFHSLVVRIVAYETDERVDQFVRDSLVPIPLENRK